MTKIQPSFVINQSLSGVSLLLIFSFITLISYYREPLGDDVLSQFSNNLNYYLDDYKGNSIGNQITEASSLYQSVKNNYLNWGGRLVGAMMLPLLSIFGQAYTAIITGSLYVFLIVIAGLLIFKNVRELFKHPLVIILLFLLLFYFNPSINYLLMWTFTSIYIVSAVLLGTYYYLYKNYLFNDNDLPINSRVIYINIFGFVAGITHEVFSFTILSLVLFLSLQEIYKNKRPLRKIFLHTGLLLGTMVCVLAPGNFVRLANSHDSIRMTQSYIVKLFLVTRTTGYTIIGGDIIAFAIIFFLSTIVMLKYSRKFTKGKSNLLLFVKSNYVDMLFLLFVIVTWSFFPYIGSYGTILFQFWFLVVVFKNIYVNNGTSIDDIISKYEKSLLGSLTVLSIVIVLCFYNYPWMDSMAKTTIERRTIRENSIKENINNINVPLYDDNYSNRFNFYNYNNYKNEENKTEYYFKYYGVYMNPHE